MRKHYVTINGEPLDLGEDTIDHFQAYHKLDPEISDLIDAFILFCRDEGFEPAKACAALLGAGGRIAHSLGWKQSEVVEIAAGHFKAQKAHRAVMERGLKVLGERFPEESDDFPKD